MRYPKHLILDLQSSHNPTVLPTWEGEFVRMTNPSVKAASENITLRGSASTPLSVLNRNSKIASTLTSTIFDIHFLRKERLYTKLKYSRCPQYDIVSGGFAAILAGFIGFLISEKFGIELVDSADFYNALMYGVFAAFSLRPLLRVYSKDDTFYSPLSPKYLLLFTHDLVVMFLTSLRLYAKKIASFILQLY
jgi:hypothetical protein